MTNASPESVRFSELLRQPVEVTDQLTRIRSVRLCLRDAADLVIISADRADAEGEVIDLIERLLAGVVQRARQLRPLDDFGPVPKPEGG